MAYFLSGSWNPHVGRLLNIPMTHGAPFPTAKGQEMFTNVNQSQGWFDQEAFYPACRWLDRARGGGPVWDVTPPTTQEKTSMGEEASGERCPI